MTLEEKRMKFNLHNDPLVQLVRPQVFDFLVLGSNPFGGNPIFICNPRYTVCYSATPPSVAGQG